MRIELCPRINNQHFACFPTINNMSEPTPSFDDVLKRVARSKLTRVRLKLIGQPSGPGMCHLHCSTNILAPGSCRWEVGPLGLSADLADTIACVSLQGYRAGRTPGWRCAPWRIGLAALWLRVFRVSLMPMLGNVFLMSFTARDRVTMKTELDQTGD